MTNERGLKEIHEVFNGLEVLAEFAGNVLADGKVNIADLDDLVHLATKFSVLREAVKGSEEAVKEGQDLTHQEVVEILGRVYSLVDKFSMAKKGN